MSYKLDLNLIEEAAAFLKGKVIETPLDYSPALSEITGSPIYLKLEFLQVTGSFKPRGALFYLSTLSDEEKKKGVACASAGNHGLGVALAAKLAGVKCTIYVPNHVEKVKVEKMKKLGAEVVVSDFIGYDETILWAKKEVAKRGLEMISAFDDERIMAGNGGSIGVEVWNAFPEVQNILVPIGGGGLLAGMSYYLKEKNPHLKVIGCQHKDSAGFALSLQRGKAQMHLPAIETVAGGIEGGIGEKCFDILKTRVDENLLLTEEEIIDGFRFSLDKNQHLIEPTAAVAIAACTKLKNLKGPTVVVLTGRNVSYSTLKKLL